MLGRIPVLNGSNQIQVGNLDILVYQLVNLVVRQFRIAVQVLIRGVDDIEDFVTFAVF